MLDVEKLEVVLDGLQNRDLIAAVTFMAGGIKLTIDSLDRSVRVDRIITYSEFDHARFPLIDNTLYDMEQEIRVPKYEGMAHA